ncbi:hypothetical protein [Diaphorobacter nitroreducens]
MKTFFKWLFALVGCFLAFLAVHDAPGYAQGLVIAVVYLFYTVIKLAERLDGLQKEVAALRS